MLWNGALPRRGGVRTDALETARDRGAAWGGRDVPEQGLAGSTVPCVPLLQALGPRTPGCCRTSPHPPTQAWGLRSRQWSTARAAEKVHGEFPWKVLSCHLAQVLETFFSFSVHGGKCHQSSRGSGLPWDVVWANVALFGEVSSPLCRPCFSPFVANPLKVIRILFCFSGYLINELSSQILPKRAVILPSEVMH